MTTPKPVTDLANRLTLQRREVAYVLGVGVNKVDELRAAGVLASFMEDGSRLFPVAGLHEYVARRAAENQERAA